MIADKALDELKAWIEHRGGEYAEVANWTITKAGKATNKDFPQVVLEATSAEEHETLRGVMDPLTVEVRLESIPHEDGSAAGAYTLADHEAAATDLYCILADSAAVQFIDARGVVRCFDIRGAEGTLETEDDLRVSTIEVRMVCSTF
jgi:hypothetical protein